MTTVPSVTPAVELVDKEREYGRSCQFALNEMMTAGRVALAPGKMTTPASHDNEEECLYVLAGSGSVLLGGAWKQAAAGDFIYIPRHVTHAVRNDGADELVYLYFGTFQP